MRSHTLLRTALKFAAHKHAGQVRKGTDIPYLVHPFEVGMYLQNIGMTNDVIMAGYLHDTLEDTDTTLNELSNIFGSRIASIVAEVSATSKTNALKKAETYSPDAMKVKVADLMCNVSDIYDGYKEVGIAILDRFADGKKTIKHYKEMVILLQKRAKNMPILKKELESILTMLNSIV